MAAAVETAERALPLAERWDAVALVADLLITKGTAYAGLARRYEAAGLVEAGVRLAERHDLVATLVRGRLNQGFLLAQIDPVASLESNLAGLAEARRLGQRRFAAVFATNAAADAMLIGRWDDSLGLVAEPLDAEASSEDHVLAVSRRGIIRALRGETVDDDLDEVRRLIGTTPDRNTVRFFSEIEAARDFATGRFGAAASRFRELSRTDIGNCRQHLGFAVRASLMQGDVGSAVADLEAADATGVHGAWVDAWRTSVVAGLDALDGRREEALAAYRIALGRFREIGMMLDEAFTGLEMVMLLDPAEPEVRAAGQRAREIFAELGAATLGALVEAALAAGSPPASATGTRHVEARSLPSPT